MFRQALRYLSIAALSFVTACGGGGDSPTVVPPVTPPVVKNVSVVPGLGAFGPGARVTAYKMDGAVIDTQVTDATGKAVLNFGTHEGPFVLRVTGGPTVTYFDEKTRGAQSFGASDVLLAIVPSNSVASGDAYGVTPLTHLVAAALGIDPSKPIGAGNTVAGATAAEIVTRINGGTDQVYALLGIERSLIDIYAAPSLISASQTTVSAGSAGGLYGLILAELASRSTSSALAQAAELFAAVKGIATELAKGSDADTTILQARINSVLATFSAVTNSLATGSSSFLATGSALPDEAKSSFSKASAEAAADVQEAIKGSTGKDVVVNPGGGAGGGTGGGGTGGGGNDPDPSTSLSSFFPKGLAIASPTSVKPVAGAKLSSSPSYLDRLLNLAGDFGRYIVQRDWSRAARTLTLASPMSSAEAAVAFVPEALQVSALIQSVAEGTAPVDGNAFKLLFEPTTNQRALCFGRTTLYRDHDDSSTGFRDGHLPGGDLGISWAWEGSFDEASTSVNRGQPCTAAQLNFQTDAQKRRLNSSLMIAAAMVAEANKAGSMPSAGASANVATALNTTLSAIAAASGFPSTITVDEATIKRGSDNTYTYSLTLTLDAGTVNAKRSVLSLKHTASATAGQYDGLLFVASVDLTAPSSSPACGSSSTGLTGMTLRYQSRSTTELDYRVLSGPYCISGTGAAAISALTSSSLASLVALSSEGELDLTVYNNTVGVFPSSGTGKSSGWVGNFSLFAATIDPATQSGNYGFAWQAGAGDGWTRVFMTRLDYSTTSGSATAKGFFGYGEDFLKGESATSFGVLKGMICNWAGPGNLKTALPRFQYQSLTLSTTTGQWEPAVSGNWSKTEFAPTNNCNTTASMGFDKTYDAAGTYGATPTGVADTTATGVLIADAIRANASVLSAGSSFANDLDTLDSGTTTVQETLEKRGYSKPCFYGGSCATSAPGSGSGSGSGTGSGDGGG